MRRKKNKKKTDKKRSIKVNYQEFDTLNKSNKNNHTELANTRMPLDQKKKKKQILKENILNKKDLLRKKFLLLLLLKYIPC